MLCYHASSFFFFLLIDFYFLIPAVTTQIFNPFAEPAIPIGIPTKEVKAEMETHLINVTDQHNSKLCKRFYGPYSLTHFDLLLRLNNFLFLLCFSV